MWRKLGKWLLRMVVEEIVEELRERGMPTADARRTVAPRDLFR